MKTEGTGELKTVLTVKKAAAAWEMSPRNLYRLISEGRIDYVRIGGRALRVVVPDELLRPGDDGP